LHSSFSDPNLYEIGHSTSFFAGDASSITETLSNTVVFKNSRADVVQRIGYIEWSGTAGSTDITLQVQMPFYCLTMFTV
jgi:hypothetical protein